MLAVVAACADPKAASGDAAVDTADGASLTFMHDWSEADLCRVEDTFFDCCQADRVELPPVAASALDLRSLGSGEEGTCGAPTKLRLPSDRSRYPLMVLLPAVPAPDPACDYCLARGKPTAFGIVLELPSSLSVQWRPAIVAPPPWRYVYDHNSLAGDACLGGYQEFGERSCVRTNYGGAIGLATGQASIPPTVALIDLFEGQDGAVDTCCPYVPTHP